MIAIIYLYGKISGFTGIDLDNLTTSDGFKIDFDGRNEIIGVYSRNIGDVNNDGFDDIIINSWPYHSFIKSYIIFGQKGRRPDIKIINAETILAFEVGINSDDNLFDPIKTGDLNGDGIDDLVFQTREKVYGLYGSNCLEYTNCSAPMPSICFASKGCVCRNRHMIIQDLSCVFSCSPGYYQASDSICKSIT